MQIRNPVLLPAVALTMLGCSGVRSDPPDDCERGAPYQLVVKSPNGVLPQDTEVMVRHGGGEETYKLKDPPDDPAWVFCSAATPQTTRISCEVWVQGPITVEVTATGFRQYEEEYALVWNEHNCVVSQSLEISLESQTP